MTLAQRLLLARRHAGLTQTSLAAAIGVQRSAVSHWESSRAIQPSARNLQAVALATQVHFEWLATGRGAMPLSESARLDAVPAVEGLIVDDPVETRLLESFRRLRPKSRVLLLELAGQLDVSTKA